MADGEIALAARKRQREPVFSPTHIKAWREKAGLTQEALADLVGTRHSTLSKIERGEQQYSQRLVERIAYALNLHPCQLLYGNPNDDSSIWRIAGEAAHLTESQRRTLLRIVEAMKAELE